MISGTTRLAGVIGAPIRHSLSPAIFNAAFAAAGLDWAYAAFEVADGDAARALDGMRALGLAGLSVTMPHKDAVARLVDIRTADAQKLGAVNCVVPTKDGLVGANTDGPGFLDALRDELGCTVAGMRVVVLGAGGAARAITVALAGAGAQDVVVVNRTTDRAAAAAALAGGVGRVGGPEEVAGADLVVNATSVGMGDGQSPIPPDSLRPGQLLADIVYHPTPTPLVEAAARIGVRAVNGLGMLVHQAAHAFTLWTDLAAPVATMLEAARAGLEHRSRESH